MKRFYMFQVTDNAGNPDCTNVLIEIYKLAFTHSHAFESECDSTFQGEYLVNQIKFQV